jgi:streptomycin 6-kinase
VVAEQHRRICLALESAWFPPPDGHALMSGAEKARHLSTFISRLWKEEATPASQQTLDRALAFASEREAAHSDDDCALVHGDCHAMNTLRTLASDDDAPVYKFVDPDGLWAEPAYDLGILMRDDNDSLVKGDTIANGIARCQLLADLSGCTERAIWQWGFVERVSTGLHLIEIGQRDWGLTSLDVAEQWHALNP